MVLPIYTGTENEVLREIAKPVSQITKKTLKLIKNMKDTLIDSKGLGLAAPQVGVSERVLLANFQYGKKVGEKQSIVPLVNAVITRHSNEIVLGEEGCLSLPEIYAEVKRFKTITVKYLDEKGREQVLELADLNARIVQHEIDHLDGKLFVDYLDEGVIGKYEKELAEANQF
ncbi:MAG: peptide deformylase [bacterium]|nr:peptide deformylase [bacterium]